MVAGVGGSKRSICVSRGGIVLFSASYASHAFREWLEFPTTGTAGLWLGRMRDAAEDTSASRIESPSRINRTDERV